MVIASKLTRGRVARLATYLVLLGPAAGLLGAQASAAAEAPAAAIGAAGLGRAPGLGRSIPMPGRSSALNAVSCPSSTNCWAVGGYESTTGPTGLNQTLHWNGSAWSKVSAPSPGSEFNNLLGVSCTSAKNCWAVGEDNAINGPTVGQALHWNGSTWSQGKVPNPSSIFDELFGVRCTSAANCWAVGEDTSNSGALLNEALHWNGTKWSSATIPSPGGTTNGLSELAGVFCTSASDCWAVGSYSTNGGGFFLNQALHWNGASWTQATTPNPGGTASGATSELVSGACTSPGNCWAVGDYGTLSIAGVRVNQALHWDGTSWSLVSTPDPNGTGTGAVNSLHDVTCTSATNCWAAGDYGIASGSSFSLNDALHWDGSQWSQATTPNPGGTADGDGNELAGIRCPTSTLCWAVGKTQTLGKPQPHVNEALRWNGTTWSTG